LYGIQEIQKVQSIFKMTNLKDSHLPISQHIAKQYFTTVCIDLWIDILINRTESQELSLCVLYSQYIFKRMMKGIEFNSDIL
jgi:hypothetical protein